MKLVIVVYKNHLFKSLAKKLSMTSRYFFDIRPYFLPSDLIARLHKLRQALKNTSRCRQRAILNAVKNLPKVLRQYPMLPESSCITEICPIDFMFLIYCNIPSEI